MYCDIVEVGGVINGNFVRNKFGQRKDIGTMLSQFTDDKYETIYSYENENIHTCNFISPFYLDMDIDDIENNFDTLIRDLKLIYYRLKKEFYLTDNDIDIYFSGAKGFHLIVNSKVFGFEPSRTLNKDLKKIALYYKAASFTKCIDTSIYDYRRLLRVPNTINSKTGLYKVKVEYKDLINMSWEDMKEYASEPKKIFKKIHTFNQQSHDAFYEKLDNIKKQEQSKINIQLARDYLKKKELLPCVKYLLQNGAPNGQRNNTTVALANSLFQIGNSLEEVQEIIEIWNESKNEEPLSKSELRATILSAKNNSSNQMCYGCSTFKDLNACVRDCPIHK